MNAYYRVTKVSVRGTTYYELEIPFKVYDITVYFATSHLPHKRLAKYRPLSYFMIFSGNVLGIIVCRKDSDKDAQEPDYSYSLKIEKPNMGILKLLIEKVGINTSGVRLGRDIKPRDIINEFLKTLY